MTTSHKTDRHKEIANQGTILLSRVGSNLYGTQVGPSDNDEMGICIPPPRCVLGTESFEQYEYPNRKKTERSKPGEVEGTIYSLKKWADLAAKGNPSLLLLLFAPEQSLLSCNEFGYEVQRNKDLFLSKDCGRRFLGYLKAQEEQMLGQRAKHTNRPELVDVYGFDTKFGYHAVRLGWQGIELLKTGNVTLPIAEPQRTWLVALRNGLYSKEEALDVIRDVDDELRVLIDKVDWPDKPDRKRLDNWLVQMQLDWWAQKAS